MTNNNPMPTPPKNLADVPVTPALAVALARALIHFLDNATTVDLQTFNVAMLDETRDGSGRSGERCPQGALALAVHLADAVEHVAEGATRCAERQVEEAIRRADDADADDASEVEETENDLDLMCSLRDSCETFRDAVERSTTEARANVPID